MENNNVLIKVFQSAYYIRIRQYFWNLIINGFLMSYIIPKRIRRLALNLLGANIKGTIHGHCSIFTNKIQIMEGPFINRNCFIDNNAMITIGENVSIGYNVNLITANHSIGNKDKRGGVNKLLPIEIQDGSWIGANCTILPGTIVEKGCVIAVGSVDKGICKSDILYAGVPAKEIRQLD